MGWMKGVIFKATTKFGLMENVSQLWTWLLCLFLMVLTSIFFDFFGVLHIPLDYFAYDAFLHQQTSKVDNRVVIIEIDDRSLAELGQWPWSRNSHADLIRQINKSNPRALFLDIFVTENAADAQADQNLSIALQESKKVVLPVLLAPKQGESLNLSNLHDVNVYQPIPILAKNALLGHVANQPDWDSVIRYVDMGFEIDYRNWQHAMTLMAGFEPPYRKAMIPYSSSSINGFNKYSYLDVLAGKVPLAAFQDKYVLVGVTASGLGDINKTPFGLMPGVEVHANILSAMLQNKFIQPVTQSTQILIELIVVTSLMLAFWLLSERWHFMILLMAIPLVALSSFYLLLYQQIWVSPVMSVLLLIWAYTLWSWCQLSVALRYLKRQLNRLILNSSVYVVDSKPLKQQKLQGVVNALELIYQKQRQTEVYNEELIEFLSHDMRTPQVNILAALSVFKKNPYSSVEELSEQIKLNVSHTLDYAQSLIKLNRIHKMQINIEDCNLYHLVSSVCEQIYVQAQQKDIKLEVFLGEDTAEPEWVRVDGGLIERALVNVLSNAIRYSPKGSTIKINLTKEIIGTQKFGVISVIDQGEGMDRVTQESLLSGEGPKKVKRRVFEDGTTSLGIGWRIVHSIIVQKHNGILDVRSTVGKGTEVIVKLLLSP